MILRSSNLQNTPSESDAIAWLWDLERRRIVWATQKAVAFWREDNILDLVAREFGPQDASVQSFVSVAKILSMAQSKALAPKDNSLGDTLYRLKLIPEKDILLTKCRVRPQRIAGLRSGLYVELDHVEDAPSDPELHPDIVLARSAPVALSMYDTQGQLIRENDACQDFFPADSATNLSRRLVGGQTARVIINRTLADGLYSKSVRVNGRYGIRRARIVAQRSAHPTTGDPTITITVTDIEDSAQMWGEIARLLETAQQEVAKSKSSVGTQIAPNVVALNPDLSAIAGSPARIAEPQEVFHQMLDALPWGVLSFGSTGLIDFANKRAMELLRGKDAELPDDAPILGKKFVSLLNPITRKRVETSLRRAAQDDGRSELVYDMESRFDVNGRDVNLRMTLLGLSDRNAPHYYVILTDQTSGTGSAKAATDPISDKIDDQLRYVASLSHDMRTPLNAIIGFSEIMKDERLGPLHNDRYRDYASDIHSSSGHLLTLVNDLLDFTKYKSGQLRVAPQPTDLAGILSGAARLLDVECEQRGVQIKIDVARNLPKVNVDPVLIERALLNVLSNAVKFSPNGEAVTLSARVLDSGTVVVSIQDRGPGMSASDIELAMEPFRQTASSEKLAHERPHIRGTGLGLPLAKALVEANNGTFILKSQVGAGTRASITFPISQVVSSSG